MSMAESIMLNSVDAITQPCLTPFVTSKGSENSPSFYTRACMPSCRTIAMNLGGQPNLAIIFQSPSRLTVSKALVRSTNVMYRSTFSFLTSLLKLPCCEDHVYCPSVRNKMTCAMTLDYIEEEVRNVNLTRSSSPHFAQKQDTGQVRCSG